MYQYNALVTTTHDLNDPSGSSDTVPRGSVGIVTSPRQTGAWVQFDHLDHDVFVFYSMLRPTGKNVEHFDPDDLILLKEDYPDVVA